MITQEKNQIRSAWDNIATGYDEFVTSTHLLLSSEALRLAGLGAGMRFLDVAAGSGALSIPAARLGAHVLAVDISPAMLHQLERRAGKEGVSIQTRIMDGHALELEDNTFDVAGSQFGVMLFPDMPRGIKEMARVTKPGGTVFLIVFGDPQKVEFFAFFIAAIRSAVPGFTGPPMDPPPLPFQLRDPETLRQQLEKAGLKNVRVERTTEELQFKSGKQMWDWLMNSNPIPRQILDELQLTTGQTTQIQRALEEMVRERAGGNLTAVLTSPINIGIGIK